jgi:lipase maturation factor 1
MAGYAERFLRRWAGPGPAGPPGHLVSRWVFLRALGGIYLSAFYSLLFQIRGMLGPDGLLPAGSYLEEVRRIMPGAAHYWYAPTLVWIASGPRALLALCWVGMLASLAVVLNFWPRAMLAASFALFLSFVAAAQDFSGYQSDGMLLAAGFIALFLAPGGWRPGLGEREPPPRAALFLLGLLWFSIYFESGVAKYFGGDPSWRDFTAMNEYYQNGPLPTWIGWYAHQLPTRFHEGTAFVTLFTELAVVCLVFLPRPFRIACFFFVTALQACIILTANYAFLNYLVLFLGIFLLDDRFFLPVLPERPEQTVRRNLARPPARGWWEALEECLGARRSWEPAAALRLEAPGPPSAPPEPALWRRVLSSAGLWTKSLLLAWVFYATAVLLLEQVWPGLPLPSKPVAALEPFRVANSYGLFGRMTWSRYEIEFQGTSDGAHWVVYPFRYKPQDPGRAPGIYAPYQPRFEWNLWFASLGTWRENPFVLSTEQQLLLNNPEVLALFAANPFPAAPPKRVRAVVWQYWFTDRAGRKANGAWWHREYRGLYAPVLERAPDGRTIVSEWPQGFLTPP